MSDRSRKKSFFRPGTIAALVLLLLSIAALCSLVVMRLRAEVPEEPAVPVSVTEADPTAVPVKPQLSAGTPGETASAVPEVTPEPAATPEPEPEYFTISMVGDCTLSASPDKLAWGIGYQMTVGDDYAFPFRNTVEYLNDDYLTIAHLECVLSDHAYSSIEQFTFRSKAAYANILSEGSVEFVTLANNHTLDFGEAGYNDTAAALDAVGVKYAGEDEIYIYETDGGLKVGLYCLYNRLTGNAMSILTEAQRTALVKDSKEKLDRAVKELREAGAEYTLAVLHMGTEGNYETTDVQVELCRYAIDAGFGSVYCTHAHRLQPAELYGDGIIFYGLGNWSFGGHTNPGNGTDPASYDTGIAKITIKRVGTTAVLDGYDFIPCSISSALDLTSCVPNANTLNNYQPIPYPEGSTGYDRTLSILGGTYEGANYAVGNYWELLGRMNG